MATVYQVVKVYIHKEYHHVVASNETEAATAPLSVDTFEFSVDDNNVDIYELYETDDEPVVTKVNGL